VTLPGSDPGTLQGRVNRVTGSRAGSRVPLTTIYNKIRAEIDAYRDACRDRRLLLPLIIRASTVGLAAAGAVLESIS
jgi:hypothetical protein